MPVLILIMFFISFILLFKDNIKLSMFWFGLSLTILMVTFIPHVIHYINIQL